MEKNIVNKTWKLIVLTALAIAMTVSLGVFMYQSDANSITLEMEDEVIKLTSNSDTVEDLLEEEDIPFKEGAYINLALDTELEENMNIIIKNPKAYTISSGEVAIEINSIHNTIAEILDEQGVVLGDKDFTYPTLDTKISSGESIQLFKVREVVETVENSIPFESIVKKNNKLDIGNVNLVQEGKDGLLKTYYKKEYINGELSSTEIVNEEVLIEPISNIVEKGTKDLIVTSRGDTSYRKAITMSATAYDLSYESTGKKPGDKHFGLTASGTMARPGVVAVDPKVIPLGTKLYIQSLDGTKDYGFAIAEDTGGAIKGNKIDLFFESSERVYKFGRRKVKVYILK
ncbi:3D domain-containing protein [Tissierella sp.]|uniref:3D domain-containing protein n=1 Tax=Tissierella sp. TaxID=41274 RepID=UPI00285BC1B5|nr:3D domain-containing protein [Tissierella sp.]MDR7857604.1 3D domain-containing protein [Tissierella sp.]